MPDSAVRIAVVGRAARLPLADDIATFWQHLRAGRDAVRTIPEGRWNLDALRAYAGDQPIPPHVLKGGWLDDVMGFDPALFRVSPREARTLDPKQRMALTVAFEALEDASLAPSRRPDLHVGTYVAISRSEYLMRFYHRGEFGRPDGDRYFGTGTDSAFAAGRIGAALGCDGPAINLDTACSSSLVTVHLAIRDLLSGACDVAIAGGTHLLDRPEMSVVMDRFGILSPDARCAAFDASARGYVRGEGVGFVVLRRLDDALADGDRVLAVLAGSAVNSNGRSDNLMAPDEDAQVRLVATALAAGGLSPGDVRYVEAHGTGTSVGDPIEARALVRALSPSAERPLALGSVKTAIGHLELSAGIAGLLKAIEVVRRGEIPPHLHLTTPNPALPADGSLVFPTAPTPFPAGDGPRTALVNSFGISGTNACVIVQQAPEAPSSTHAPVPSVGALWLAAPDPERLRATAERWADALDHGLSWTQGAARAGHGRADHVTRAAIVSADPEEAARTLRRLASGEPAGLRGDGARAPRVLLGFTGQGSQRPGMGLALDRHVPAFSRALDEVDAALQPLLGRPIREVLAGSVDLSDTRWTQPALFALGWAQARAWQALGVAPVAALGHSIGELTAATLAGVWSLEDAARVVDARARGMASLPRDGGMAAVMLDADDVSARLAANPDLDLAGDNGPRGAVVSGRTAALEAFLGELAADDVAHKRLDVSHAFHSVCMEPMLDGFREVLEGVAMQPAAFDVYSNVTGQAERAALADPEHWVRQVRGAVRFAEGLRAAVDAGCDVLLEAGPDATLCGMARRVLRGRDVALLSTLPREGDRDTLHEPASALWVRGQTLDVRALHGSPAPFVPLPSTPQIRRHLEVDDPGPSPVATVAKAAPQAEGPALWRVRWDPIAIPAAAWPGGTWIVAGGAPAEDAAVLLEGAACDVVRATPSTREAWSDLLRLHAPVAGVVVAATLSPTPPQAADPAFEPALVASVFTAVAALQAVDAAGLDLPLVLWTRSAQAVSPAEAPQALPAALWGAFRTMRLEHRSQRMVLHDLGAGDPLPPVERWLPDAEDAIAWRRGAAFAPRLVQAGTAASTPPPVRGTWLITGGSGGLGPAVGAWLGRQGAARVVLASRRAPDAERQAWLDARRAEGLALETATLDVADADAVRALVQTLDTPQAPLRGVVHAAGLLADAPVRHVDAARFTAVLPAKAVGAAHLDAATRDRALDAFVVFSSVTATLGAPTQVNYGAANASMEALVAARRASGLPGQALGWGPWSEVGMAAGLVDRMAERGMSALSPDDALALMGEALTRPDPLLLPMDVRLTALRAADPARLDSPLLRAVSPPRSTPERAFDVTSSQERPATGSTPTPPPAPPSGVLDGVVALAAQLLGFSADELDPDRPLAWQGLDSVLAVDLRDGLKARFGVDLPLDAVVSGPRPRELAERVLAAGGVPRAASPSATPAPTTLSSTPSSGGGATIDRLDREVSALLSFDPGELDRDRPLAWQGFDSVLAVDLHARIREVWGVEVPLDALATGPRLSEIADRLPSHAPADATRPAPVEAPPVHHTRLDDEAGTPPNHPVDPGAVEEAPPPPAFLWVLLALLLLGIGWFAVG